MKKILMYRNRHGDLLSPSGFKRLNGNKNLTQSQLKLLKLKKEFFTFQ